MTLFALLFLSFTPSPERLKTLYKSLDPTSVQKLFAFYTLYPDTAEGKAALRDALKLLSNGKTTEGELAELPSLGTIHAVINLVNRPKSEKLAPLSKSELALVGRLASDLGNRKKRGFLAKSEAEVLALPSEEIDLARALLLSENLSFDEMESYEALLDLMALQIRARLPKQASEKEKVRAISSFIFDEMQFCFPPHSEHAKEIDLYTFLPSVLDSRRGVCLGVSILYLALAERLDLKLEIITPPGHIYVRLPTQEGNLNIETTARGIHLDDKEYLGLNTKMLKERSIKETVGFAHFNKAAVFWSTGEYEKAKRSYEKALLYIDNDLLTNELYAYTLLLTGEKKRGKNLLQSLRGKVPEETLYREPLAEDYLLGKVDEEGIKAMFLHVDEGRASLEKKESELKAILKRFPEFRSGWESLAMTELQLHRQKEAIDALVKCDRLDGENPTVVYILAALSLKRVDYKSAWKQLLRAEKIVKAKGHDPEALKELRQQLTLSDP